jgi:hypothetical protein
MVKIEKKAESKAEKMFHEAIKDPSSVFKSPQDVVKSDIFTDEQKEKILSSWELDQTRLQESESENMPPPEKADEGKSSRRIRQIHKARENLED